MKNRINIQRKCLLKKKYILGITIEIMETKVQ